MAKLKVLPALAIISGFKGVIDYYVYHPTCDPENAGKGIPCARRWPRSPGRRRADAVEAQWPAWTYASKAWSYLSQYVQDAYNRTAASTPLSGRDLFTKSFIKDYFREGQWD